MSKQKGLIHIICGDGKGKTTAAIGLSVRAAGTGRKVLITRFLKNERSGELASLDQIHLITVMPVDRFFGFTWNMTEKQKKEAKVYYTESFRSTIGKAVKEAYDLLVLDEIMAALTYGFVEEKEVIAFLQQKPENLEVVMTGRNPSLELCKIADYISEVKKIKHPMDQGIPAREGIEY